MTVATAALLLFLVMDPLGNVPFFLSALKEVPPERQNRVVLRELLIPWWCWCSSCSPGRRFCGCCKSPSRR